MGGFMKMLSPAAMVADKGPKVLSPAAMVLDKTKKKADPRVQQTRDAKKSGAAGTSLLGSA
jgi:hypothetical protein